MTAHTLKMYHLTSRTLSWRSSPEVIVTVVSDRWQFDTGREIEFYAMNMPDSFAFVVDGLRNNQDGQRWGDSRSGSWAGIASKIAPNKYQGIQASGTSNEASGLIAYGTAVKVAFGHANGNEAGTLPLGMYSDGALVEGYSKDVVIGSNTARFTKPEFGNPADPDPTIRTVLFGDAVDQQTKTIRQGASKTREAMYRFSGALATTQFYPRTDSNNAVGGVTFAYGKTVDQVILAELTLMASAAPISDGAVSEKKDGNGRVATWKQYFLAGASNVSPYQPHYLLLDIGENGSFVFGSNSGFTPGPNGAYLGFAALTIFSDDKQNTADTLENRAILTNLYYSTKARNRSYVIKRPMVVPHRFNVVSNKTLLGYALSESWLISADFINYEYTIGE
ncbi:minor structural protein [Lactococcus phage Q54]|uniref:Minor structural protein n=1 Tax=Lactococcus phage Q54 TaxID=382685 RepID=Q0GXU2_9CAUD|nr:minor structural protein [Lactococcus phage Q54]ABF22584.1 minor structural protein [Lactococcus phage Q54]